MKKILLVIVFLILFTGCSLSTINDNKPQEAIDTLFEKYRNKDDNVIEQLKDTIENELSKDEQKKEYEKLMEKQYDNLSYEIKNVDENKDTATATVDITVLNYKSAINDAEKELKNNPEKFNDDNNNFSEEKFMDYKIELMKDVKNTVTHTLNLTLTKSNGMWMVDDLSSDDITKIHGLY